VGIGRRDTAVGRGWRDTAVGNLHANMADPRPSPPMPNFFVIGANRAGTTSLHDYLGQHPDVFMSAEKEPSYFAPKSAQERALWPAQQAPVETLDEYCALFAAAGSASAIGESSTVYLSSADAPALVRDAVPRARLVAVLRDPVERAYSDYCLHRSWGTEPLSFADAVSAELDHAGPVGGRMRGYVMTGLYGRSLTRWLDRFAREQLGVWLYEELEADPGKLVSEIFAFLGVDPSFRAATTARRNASRHEPRSRTVDRLARAGAVRSVARRVLPDRAWVRAREYVRHTNSVAPELPAEVRTRLVELYRDDIAATERIIDRDLSAWLT
jgi:hypothetical protein